MKRYRFSLETVLHVRRNEEEAARQNLAAANHALRRSRALLMAETERYRARVDAPGPCDLATLRANRLSAEQIAACVAAARSALDVSAAAAAARRIDWNDAARRVATLERLDERRRDEWAVEVRRQEDAEVNDIVTSRWSASAPRSGS